MFGTATHSPAQHKNRHEESRFDLGAPYRMVAHRVDRLRDDIRDAASERAQKARRLARHGRMAAEDSLDQAALRVRRHPARAMTLAFLAGGVTTLAAAMFIRLRLRRR